ncbi:hypothetical protein EDD96_5635 [Streptomyces sp. Ag109_G2-6]|uniref:hypothetical protein n=1 Tax=Streptomyces TaxID=1883 RepID=UPI000F4DC04C|nr:MULTISPECIES: hypothetical protein [Streptomyces]RPF41814.1 hypothetical protein EDD96_5635 [Streptomyces sp. Ag109_G2-6]
MSCRRRTRPPAAALFALVMGVLALVLALAGPVPGTADRHPAPQAVGARAGAASAAAAPAGAGRAAARPGDGPRAVVAGAEPGPGPACAPGSGGAGTEPALPARAGHEHGSVLVARAVPEGVRPYRAACVQVPVRGPGQRAPGPVELNVMRV